MEFREIALLVVGFICAMGVTIRGTDTQWREAEAKTALQSRLKDQYGVAVSAEHINALKSPAEGAVALAELPDGTKQDVLLHGMDIVPHVRRRPDDAWVPLPELKKVSA